ncbi:hypothetical protein Bbelb_247590 [Branchiostoma belcheri]|nr:hypothetical protein Bbelb_247590 [Branchiostoma belcheri]
MKQTNTMVRLAWFAFLCCVALATSRGTDRPNFVFFVADDLGIGDVGCFGNDTIRTPNIDRIAAKGAKLTQHLAAAAVCTPSRSAFLTGRYPIRYGMVGTDLPLAFVQLAIPSGLPRSEVTFPQLAKGHGYRTALLGKWHLGLNCGWAGDHCHHPSKFGFDYFYGLPLSNGLDCDPEATEFRGRSRHGLYGDAVEELDWSVGVVMATLERLGLTENTFVYFTSDNGGHIETGVEGGSNGIYKGGKGQGGSEGGIRMPTLVQWPRKIKPGTVVSEATSQMDIFPTVADILGAPLPQDKVIDGRNIMPLLGGAAVTSPHDVLFHYCSEYLHAVRYRPREGNVTWKAHFVSYNWDPGTSGCYSLRICRCAGQEVTHNDPPLLYDVTNDPVEARPISDPRYPVVMGVIKKAVEEHVKSLTEVEKQIGLSNFIPRPWLQECCNFPFCDCKEDVDLSSLKFSDHS